MFSSITLLFTFIFLAGTAFLTAVNSALRRIQGKDVKRQLKQVGGGFFYRPIHNYFFSTHEYEGLFFATICALNVTRFFYAASMLGFLSQTQFFERLEFDGLAWVWMGLSVLAFILIAFVFGDYLPRIFGSRYPLTAMRVSAPVASIFMLLVFPLTYVFLKVSHSFSNKVSVEPSEGLAREEIIDMIQRATLGSTFDVHDRKLIESVVRFKERIAREVMVPRVDVFSLSAEIPIKEAAPLLVKEGYSRIPVYRNTVDNIVGVLMYKDVLKKYLEYEQGGRNPKILEAPIETIQKPVLHTPETKKISSLLQDFRKKQVHLAIVVDEYGGTQGIVTIEDILEEIVGDIADEYDLKEEKLFYKQSDGSWIVDARMNILDVDEELGIKIPQEGEYDTIGGYVFHTTGTIPSRGFVIHQDQFDMEILDSNDRSVEKVRISPVDSTSHNLEQQMKGGSDVS